MLQNEYPHTPCEVAGCTQRAKFRAELAEDEEVFLCHGHSQSKAYREWSLEELPKMWVTFCHSGDTWVTCDKHKNVYTIFSSHTLKQIHTAHKCAECEVEKELLHV